MAKSKLPVKHQRLKLLERSIGYHVEFEHLIERISLPLRARNVSAKHNPRKINLANPTGDDDKDVFLEPNQGDEEENFDEDLDLNSQNDSNQSKTLSGVKELQEQQPEDDASSAKKPRKGISQ